MLIQWAKLVRLPNVVTVISDILLGFWVITWMHPKAFDLVHLAYLILSSICFYWAGMILNDVFDLATDLKERPTRPIPSGYISKATAMIAGWLLLGFGLLFAWLCQPSQFPLLPTYIAIALTVSILAYNMFAKQLWFGPIIMAACRFFNVLLGGSITGFLPDWNLYLIAAILAVYVLGLTIFAKYETSKEPKNSLSSGFAIMVAVILPSFIIPYRISMKEEIDSFAYVAQVMLVLLWAGFVLIPAWNAMKNPEPAKVQHAVKTAILGIVAVDAFLAVPFSFGQSMLLLLLLIPAFFLGKYIYST